MELNSLSPGLIVVTVVFLSVAPFVAVMITSFTKLVVVLSLLRNALGLQQVPPNVVINGLSIILSIYVMYPVGMQMSDIAVKSTGGSTQGMDAKRMLEIADQAKEPLKAFLVRHTSEDERTFFLRTAQRLMPPEKRDAMTAEDMLVVVPAFTVNELTRAFQIGFLIFLPFLVIDMIISNILLALGMMMLSPTTVSLPFKLLLFVLLDGWSKLIHGLVMTYR